MSVHTWQGLLFNSVLTGQPVCVSTKDSLLDKREAVHSPTLSDFQKSGIQQVKKTGTFKVHWASFTNSVYTQIYDLSIFLAMNLFVL